MKERKLDKDLIFFIPGKPGSVFTYQAGFAVNNDLLSQTVDGLLDVVSAGPGADMA